MFCATFYSFKGGVGRSLALMNVAATLAKSGKKVLLVDFDLEAPGLVTFEPFQKLRDKPGMVDFVGAYLATNQAPDATDFIHGCLLADDYVDEETGALRSDESEIYLMPAGQEDGYAQNFASIDWTRLYHEQNGFLLMEDLRGQWEKAGFDYVLIDSRTGHTDIGGICTRQLPDAVVALFFPNEQNLVGLKHVVEGIRGSSARTQKIDLLFAASRIPRLDDEDGDLKRWLDRFQDELGYTAGSFAKIEHYDSLMFLDQAIFTLKRPKSALARQYRALSGLLTSLNDEDADGAHAFVLKVANNKVDSGPLESTGSTVIDERLAKIAAAHPQDQFVQYQLARAYYRLRNLTSALEAADLASKTDETGTAFGPVDWLASANHRLRLKIAQELNLLDKASDSALAILDDPNAKVTMVIDAVLALSSYDAALLKRPQELEAIRSAPTSDLYRMASEFEKFDRSKKFAADLAEFLLDERDLNELDPAADRGVLQLLLISAGRYARALEVKCTSDDPSTLLRFAFNDAMATWGLNGEPTKEMFEALALSMPQVSRQLHTANGRQCLALCHAVLGNQDALLVEVGAAEQSIDQYLRREYSCWSYSTVSVDDFKDHLRSMVLFGQGKGPGPAVFRQDLAIPVS